ncbi:MAG: hypothetical protein Q9218_005588, partial [Villophora microphyllina]
MAPPQTLPDILAGRETALNKAKVEYERAFDAVLRTIDAEQSYERPYLSHPGRLADLVKQTNKANKWFEHAAQSLRTRQRKVAETKEKIRQTVQADAGIAAITTEVASNLDDVSDGPENNPEPGRIIVKLPPAKASGSVFETAKSTDAGDVAIKSVSLQPAVVVADAPSGFNEDEDIGMDIDDELYQLIDSLPVPQTETNTLVGSVAQCPVQPTIDSQAEKAVGHSDTVKKTRLGSYVPLVPFQIQRITDLEGEHMNHPIAALIVGIAQAGIKHGIASDWMQLWARRSSDHGAACLTSPTTMVIPLTMSLAAPPCGEEQCDGSVRPPTQEEIYDFNASEIIGPGPQGWLGGVGHLLVVTASRENGIVKLKYMDSAPALSRRGSIRAAVRGIIRNCGWIQGVIRFGQEEWPPTPQQQVPNTCGLHVVVNAWSDLLKLTINPFWTYKAGRDFYNKARQLCNKAVLGKSSAREIQTWLLQQNYAVLSTNEANDAELAIILQADTVWMTNNVLDQYLTSESVVHCGNADSPLDVAKAIEVVDPLVFSNAIMPGADPEGDSAVQHSHNPFEEVDECEDDEKTEGEEEGKGQAEEEEKEEEEEEEDNWDTNMDLRTRAFGLMDYKSLKALLREQGLDIPRIWTYRSALRNVIRNLGCKVPKDLQDRRLVGTLRWPNLSFDELLKKSHNSLRLECHRLLLTVNPKIMAKTDDNHREMARMLLNYIGDHPQARTSSKRDRRQTRQMITRAQAKELGITTSYKASEGKYLKKSIPVLQADIETAKRLLIQRKRLPPDPKLPKVTVNPEDNNLVCLISRFSYQGRKENKDAQSRFLDECEVLVRDGAILPGLHNATFFRAIFAHTSFAHPLNNSHELLRLVDAIKALGSEGHVLFVFMGVDGAFTGLLDEYRQFTDRFLSLQFTMVIGEALAQWIPASIEWAYIDWVGPLMDRFWSI